MSALDMFGSTALSLPPPFTADHHPLRASSEFSRPQPSGGCNFLLVQPSAKSKICACQVYHHNRSAPGNVCDCGHSACFHVHTFGGKPTDGSSGVHADTTDKIRKLEDMILAERRARESDCRELQRENKALRDALTPFYRIEDEIHRKLALMEAKLHTTTEEQRRFQERMKHSEPLNVVQHKGSESAPPLRSSRKPSHASTSQAGDDVPSLTSSDERSSASSFSRHQTPSEALLAVVEPESPRSSGILNLVSHPRPSVLPTAYVVPRPAPQSQEEPRSSGFLGVDMRDYRKPKSVRKRQRGSPTSSAFTESTEHGLSRSQTSKSPRYENAHSHTMLNNRPFSSTISPDHSTPSRSLPRPSPPANTYQEDRRIYQGTTGALSYPHSQAARQPSLNTTSDVPFLALDVLANVSTASTGVR